MTDIVHCPCGTTHPSGDWCPDCEDDLVSCLCGAMFHELDEDGREAEQCDRCREWAQAVQDDLDEIAAAEAAEETG